MARGGELIVLRKYLTTLLLLFSTVGMTFGAEEALPTPFSAEQSYDGEILFRSEMIDRW